LFLRSISSSIICPDSARKYFKELKFEEYAPVYWKKIEPFIIIWEKEIERLKQQKSCVMCETVSCSEIKNAIKEIKIQIDQSISQQELLTPIDENLEQVDKLIDPVSYPMESSFEIQMEETQEDETLLGKRTQEEIIIDQIELETKEPKLE